MCSPPLFPEDRKSISLKLTNHFHVEPNWCHGKNLTINFDVKNLSSTQLGLNHNDQKATIIINAQSTVICNPKEQSVFKTCTNTNNCTPSTEISCNCEERKTTNQLLKTDYEKLRDLGKLLQIANTSIQHVSVESSSNAGDMVRECQSLPNLSTCKPINISRFMINAKDKSYDFALRSLNIVKNELNTMSLEIKKRMKSSTSLLQQSSIYRANCDSKQIHLIHQDENKTKSMPDDTKHVEMSTNNCKLMNTSKESLQNSVYQHDIMPGTENMEHISMRLSDSITSQYHDVPKMSEDKFIISSISKSRTYSDGDTCSLTTNEDTPLETKLSPCHIQILTSNSIINLSFNESNSSVIKISHRSISNAMPSSAKSQTEEVLLDLQADLIPIYKANDLKTLNVKLQLPQNQRDVTVLDECIFSFIHRLPMIIGVTQETASSVRITSEQSDDETERGLMLPEVCIRPGPNNITVPLHDMRCARQTTLVKHLVRARRQGLSKEQRERIHISSSRCVSDSSVSRKEKKYSFTASDTRADKPSKRRHRCRSNDVNTSKKKPKNKSPQYTNQPQETWALQHVEEEYINVDIFVVSGDKEEIVSQP